jgi:hypothetical protein
MATLDYHLSTTKEKKMVSCTSNHKYNYILKEEYTNYSSYKFESCGLLADYISYKFVFQENFFFRFLRRCGFFSLTLHYDEEGSMYSLSDDLFCDLKWQHAATADYNLITSNIIYINIITINHNANINSYLRNYLRL